MPFEYWRWHVEREPENSSALAFGWYETFAKHRHQAFRKAEADQNGASLKITLDTDSLISYLSHEGTDLLSVLLYFLRYRSDLLTAIRTPAISDSFIPELLAKVDSIEYGEAYDEPYGPWRSVSLGSWYSSVREMPIDEILLRRSLGPSATESEVVEIRNVWKEIEAHRAFRGDVFVTGREPLLKYRDALGPLSSVWILNVGETLGYLETTAKGRGHYFFNQLVRTNRWSYYSERTKQEVPHLDKFGRFVRTPGWVHDAKADLSEYIHSLETRLRYLMEARDQVGFFYYMSAGMDENDAVLYHVNHFFLLATAVFDNLAWVLNHFYDLGLPRTETVLWHRELRDSVSGRFRSLIDSRLSLMDIFIETRHSVAHRLVMWGIGFRELNTDAGANLVEIDESMAKAIGSLDSAHPTTPYTDWGVARSGSVVLLEPYRFCTGALVEVLRFVDEFFELLGQEIGVHVEDPIPPELDRRSNRRRFATPLRMPIV
jgi:hypothetical protein